jgi:DNA-binding FadR family transcriptional regulator
VNSTSSNTRPPSRPASRGLHGDLLDRLGLAITQGELAPGAVVTLEELETLYNVSRPVVREVVRVLESMGMASLRRRIGVVVLPREDWNLFDPQIIRWRLSSEERLQQLQALMEVRMAVEPEAARLAAARAKRSDAGNLMGVAGQLWVAGEEGDRERFVELDIEFHRLVLQGSGNEMFGRLSSVVTEMLLGRSEFDLDPPPDAAALQLHVDVANAIQRGAPDEAHAKMVEVMRRTMDEITPLLRSLSA